MNVLALKKHFSATVSDRSDIQVGDILQDGSGFLYVVAKGGVLIPIRTRNGSRIDGRFSWMDTDLGSNEIQLSELKKWNGMIT